MIDPDTGETAALMSQGLAGTAMTRIQPRRSPRPQNWTISASRLPHEHSTTNALLDLRDHLGVDRHLAEHAIEMAETACLECRECLRITVRAYAGKIQIRCMDQAQRGERWNIERETPAEIRHEHIGRDLERRTSALRRDGGIIPRPDDLAASRTGTASRTLAIPACCETTMRLYLALDALTDDLARVDTARRITRR